MWIRKIICIVRIDGKANYSVIGNDVKVSAVQRYSSYISYSHRIKHFILVSKDAVCTLSCKPRTLHGNMLTSCRLHDSDILGAHTVTCTVEG